MSEDSVLTYKKINKILKKKKMPVDNSWAKGDGVAPLDLCRLGLNRGEGRGELPGFGGRQRFR